MIDRIGLPKERSTNPYQYLMMRSFEIPDSVMNPNIHQNSVLRNMRKRFAGCNLGSEVEKNILSAYENDSDF